MPGSRSSTPRPSTAATVGETPYATSSPLAVLPAYVLSGAYALKLALSGEGYGSGESRTRDIVVGAAATVFGLWLIYAAGVKYLLMCAVLFAPGIAVYLKARKERGERAFTGPEAAIALGIGVLAVVAAVLMLTGKVSPL